MLEVAKAIEGSKEDNISGEKEVVAQKKKKALLKAGKDGD